MIVKTTKGMFMKNLLMVVMLVIGFMFISGCSKDEASVVDVEVSVVESVVEADVGAVVGAEVVEVITYGVKRGDTLWDIAKAHGGVGMDWVKIYEANEHLGSNPDLIYPGQVIVIPNLGGS